MVRSAIQKAAFSEARRKAICSPKKKLLKKQHVIEKMASEESNISNETKSNVIQKKSSKICERMRNAKKTRSEVKQDIAAKRRKQVNEFNEIKEHAKDKVVIRKKRSPKKNPKPFFQISASEKCRRRRMIEKIAPQSQLTPQITVEDACRMQAEANFTKRDMAVIRKHVPGVAAYKARTTLRKQIVASHPQLHSVTSDGIGTISYFDFGEVLTHDLKTIGINKLPSSLTIVLSGDYGQQTLKVGYYIVERNKPCSAMKFKLLSSFEGKEEYNVLKTIFSKALVSVPTWKEGKIVQGKEFRCKFVLTGDLKFLNIYWGLQCNAATYFCCSCLIKNSDLKNGGTIAEKRTLAQIIQDYEDFQVFATQAKADEADAILKTKTEKAKSKAKGKCSKAIAEAHKLCHSVKDMPMTDLIEIENTCHGVLHVISGSLNAIMEFVKSTNAECIDKIIKEAHVKLQGYNKKLTGNHGRILLDKLHNGKVEYNGPAAEIFYIIAFIQKYAVARVISDTEIIGLEDCIDMFSKEIFQDKYKTLYGKSQHIHVLIAHVLDFVKLHKSWGLYSDQPGEAIHKTQKLCFALLPVRIDNPIDRNQYFINETIIRHELLS